ncbi:LysR substrate-binding domain-containing protein [Pseudomonas guineae]|uniref:LysR substrate-binding domain-containing protein n=1 Tax=Pseudomonas guineae TaxID=425504 RepID=UPI003CFE313D
MRVQVLFRDRYVGVVRLQHPLSQEAITPASYAAGKHIFVSRAGLDEGPIDEALRSLGLRRKIVIIVSGFLTALGLVRGSDLIASVPERHTANLRQGMFSFPLPVSTAQFTVSFLWHPQLGADPSHRWLRKLVIGICAKPT